MEATNSTRYLCAAALVNSGFRKLVHEKILNERYRAISLPAGIDLLAICRYIHYAQRLNLARNLIVSTLFLFALVLQVQSRSGSEFELSFPFNLIFLYFSLPFFLSWLAICFFDWFVRYKVIAKNLLKHNFDLGPLRISFEVDKDIRERLNSIISDDQCNVIVYSGFSPFVGSGSDIGGWSFTLDISKGKEDLVVPQQPEPFCVEDMYSFVDNKLNNAGINNLTIRDKIFVNGQDIRTDSRFLPDIFSRPVSYIDPGEMLDFIRGSSKTARHYKCFRIMTWDGEIILSVFLRFFKQSQDLFVEASNFLLPPLKPEYKTIDGLLENPTWLQLGRLMQDALLKSIYIFPLSLIYLLADLLAPIQADERKNKDRQTIRENPMFDYGTSFSVRESAAADFYDRYFQKLDKEMFYKLIERRILDAITEFLDQHNIDTSDLRSRQKTILNNGVIVTGGSVDAQNLSVGERAKLFVNNIAKNSSTRANASG